MVEIFCKRGEIMPSDESVEQHKQKQAEEVALVDKDKTSPQGLFKGTFRFEGLADLLFDEADGVLRCPYCQHEHEGGPLCATCGTRFEGPYDDDDEDDPYGFSDIDDDVDADLELADLEVDVDQEYNDRPHFHHFMGQIPHFHHFLGTGLHGHFHRVHHHHYDESVEGYSGNDSSSGSEEDEEDDEGSLQDFVVQDEEPENEPNRRLTNVQNNRQPIITISDDDESDEDEPVPPVRRHRNRRHAVLSSSPLSQPTNSITDSENGETNANADMLRDAGWSPLDTENEDEDERPIHNVYREYATTDDEQNSDVESDTNTMRNDPSDNEDDRSCDDTSEPPSYASGGALYLVNGGFSPGIYDNGSEVEYPHSMDRDGDTEMSASPGRSTSSRSASVSTGYGYDEDAERQIYGYDDDEGTPRGPHGHGNMGEDLGVANEIHNVDDDDSSDVSIQPPPRRRPRQPRSTRVQQTDPRISMMFAEHQMSLRGAQNQRNGLDEFEVELRSSEPATRNQRMTSYRLQPPRRAETLRGSRSPSATRIISSSNRVSRPPRQYQRRYH